MHFSKLVLISALGLIAASSANAQKIGTYTGTTADGAAVTVIVAHDPNNSNLEVTGLSFLIDMTCEKSGETVNGIQLGLGDGHDIIDRVFNYSSGNFLATDIVANMHFAGNNSVKGSVAGELAAFNPGIGHDTFVKQVQRCFNPKQGFTATRGTGTSATAPKPALTMRGTDGTTITIGYQPRSMK